MIQVRDTCEESGAHRKLVTSILTKTAFVKSASAEPEPRTSVQQYADTFNKMWPIDTVPQILESAVSIMLQKDAMHVTRFKRVNAELTKRAYAIGAFEDVVLARQAALDAMSPVKSASTEVSIDALKKLATMESVSAMRSQFAYPARREIAVEILDTLAAHNVVIDDAVCDALEKTAGRGINSPAALANVLVSRAEKIMSLSPREGRELIKAAEDIYRAEMPSTEDIVKLASQVAEVVDRIDKKFGLDRLYSVGFKCPEDAVFDLTMTKIAKLVASTTLIGNMIYDNADLLKTSAEVLAPVNSELPKKVASADGKIDPAKLASEAKFAGADVINRVFAGFGIRHSTSIPVAPVGKVAADAGMDMVRANYAAWDRLARRYAGDDIIREGNQMTFAMRHPQHVSGDRPSLAD